jgi:hypothetical protein
VNAEPRRVALVGWALVVLVAILMLVFRGSEEAGPAVVFAAIALAVGAWLWFRDSRAALIVSLVLGVLWLLQFSGARRARSLQGGRLSLGKQSHGLC